jgi:hypothetical protein
LPWRSCQDRQPQTPLSFAAKKGYKTVLKLLLDSKNFPTFLPHVTCAAFLDDSTLAAEPQPQIHPDFAIAISLRPLR